MRRAYLICALIIAASAGALFLVDEIGEGLAVVAGFIWVLALALGVILILRSRRWRQLPRRRSRSRDASIARSLALWPQSDGSIAQRRSGEAPAPVLLVGRPVNNSDS